MLSFYFCTLLFTFLFTSSKAQDVCVKKTACSCVFPNGTGFDLSPTVKISFDQAQFYQVKLDGTQYDIGTYYYHPCADVLLPKPIIPNITDTCNKPLALCRHVNTMKMNATTKLFSMDNGIYEYLGSSVESIFSDNGASILYQHGPSNTTVLLTCAESNDMLSVYSLDEPDDIVLQFYSREACLKQLESPGRSFGSNLLIIFFSFLIFYLVLGVCTKKFLMGATGIEVVPNLAFWSDLPNLVKDGWAFAINGFKLPVRGPGPVTSPDPNSYDSI